MQKGSSCFLVENTPHTYTLDSFLLFPSSLASRSEGNFAKKTRLFVPWPEAAGIQLVVWIAWLVGAGGADNVEISPAFQLCFPPMGSRRRV